MSALALALVLTGACCHAWWNLILKRTGGGTGFFLLFSGFSAILLAPVALIVWWIEQPVMGWPQFAMMALSGVLHLLYFLALDHGYKHGDLSVVYPLARGTGPVLTLAGAMLLLGERPSGVAIGGALLIASAVIMLVGDPRKLRESGNLRGVAFALLTGCLIASYTLTDKQAVAALMIPPILYDWGTNVMRLTLLTPIALRNREGIREAWKKYRKEAIFVAILSPTSYILALTAMRFTPVSYVAPAREVSILIATVLGAKVLAEADAGRRLAAAALMIAGLAALALG
ncbi:MAG: EamA family transporter [Casimicrobiaceae bacterium]